MKGIKRLTALLLAGMLTFSTGYYDTSAAAAAVQNRTGEEMQGEMPEDITEDPAETAEGPESVPGTGDTEASPVAEDIQAPPEIENQEPGTESETEGQEDTQKMLELNPSNDTDTEGAQQKDSETAHQQEEALANYVMIESARVETPGTQNVVIGVGKDDTVLNTASLTYRNKTTGKQYTVDAAALYENMAKFTMEFPDESLNGSYELLNLSYTADGIKSEASFSEMGITAVFGVNEDVNANPDDIFVSEEDIEKAAEISADVVTIDENGREVSAVGIEEAIAKASQGAAKRKAAGVDAAGAGGVVVVLDPGHGGAAPGTVGNGLVEKNLNLKIAQYCKEELEQYSGVTVYMTRTGDYDVALADRVSFAVSKGATVFVSLHNNASTNTAAHGVSVYYPNANYNAAVGAAGAALAQKIQDKLVALGITNGGIRIRNSESGDTYPDGSLCDYYAVIRAAKKAGIPGLIVEHAFVSNASDAANFLSSDDKLKSLGVADATGIAEYFGLKKGNGGFSNIKANDSTSMDISWNAMAGVSGYQIYRSTSIDGNYDLVATISSQSVTSWRDTGLTPGTTYYYKIRSYTKSGDKTKYGQLSEAGSGTTLSLPEITRTKSISSRKLEITWRKIDNTSSYRLYRSTSPDGSYQKIATISGADNVKYTDTTVNPGTAYYYKVRSVGVVNGAETVSSYSAPFKGVTAAAPKITGIKSQNSTSLKITWNKVAGISGYTVRRSTSKNGKYKKIATINSADTTSYTDKYLKTGKNYYYKIQAFNHNNSVKGYSDYSGAKNGKTVAKTKITKLVSNSSGQVKLTWKKVSGANGYRIYRSTSKNGSYTRIKTISSGKTTSYTDKNATGGTKYYYKIRTRNKVNGWTGYGDYSSTKNVSLIGKAKITSVTANATNKLVVNWEKVSGASGYDIYRTTSKKGTYKKIGSTSGDSTTSYKDKKLKMGSKYYYKVQAKTGGVNGTSYGARSKGVSARTVKKTELASVQSTGEKQLTLTWKKIGGSTGYQIYRSTQEEGGYKKVGEITNYKTVTYTDAVPESGTAYYYKVRLVAKDGSKKVYGEDTDPVAGMSLSAPGLTLTPAASDEINITVAGVAGADSYRIYRSTSVEGNYTHIASLNAGSSLTHADKGLAPGTMYYYKAEAVNATYGSSGLSSAVSAAAIPAPSITSVSYGVITWTDEPAAAGYTLYRSSSENSTEAKIAETTLNSYTDNDLKAGVTYFYRVRAYMVVNGNRIYGSYSDAVASSSTAYQIMGTSTVSTAQMAAFYQKSGKQYPANVYAGKGAPDLNTFCQLVYEECEAEGVKAEVIFAQVCLETNYLQFGGQVGAQQCNFGGLGALDSGVTGETFPNVQIGLRAQVQHMKAYASTEPLKQGCVDTRFNYISRGCAAYVEQLGNGKWATDPAYAAKLLRNIQQIKSL